MKISSVLVSSLVAILVETVWTLNSNPIRSANCSVDEKHYFEVSVNYIQNEISVNCRNGSFNINRVKECVHINSIDLFMAHSCILHANLSDISLRNVKILYLLNVFTEDTFFIGDLNIENLHIQKATAKELRLDNLWLLKHLTIMSMDWKTISGKPFQNVEGLRALFLTSNKLEYLEEDTFYNLRQLMILNLSENKLETLPHDLFKNMERLSYLFLDKNRIKVLNSTIFSKLRSLTRLSISENLLQEVPEDLISSNLKLVSINLSNNLQFNEIPEGIFKNSRKLLSFRMSGCGLRFLPVNIFRSCPLIKEITLANNRLKTISANMFFSVSLSHLDLSNNSLSSLPANLFSSTHRLQYLDLSQNHFFTIPSNAISDMFSLTELNLNSNKIEVINAKDFDSLTNLKALDLSNNRIRNLTLGKTKALLHINLSHNSVETFPNISLAAEKLKLIDLSYNNLTYVTTDDLSFKTNTTINLQYNQITSLYINSTFQTRLIIYLGFNPFVCNCSLMTFVRFIQNKTGYSARPPLIVPDVNNLTCNVPLEWKDKALIGITYFHLCPDYAGCPIGCRCYRLQDYETLVNCSDSGMTVSPTVLPTNASIVHLEDNVISDFPTLSSNTWENVTHIYLDRNQLISSKHWTPPTLLKALSLRNNNITSLPIELQNFISSTSSFVLDIRDNPWKCDCDLLPFKRWFTKNLNKLVRPKEIVCTTQINQKTVFFSIQETPEDAFCIPHSQLDKNIQTILATVLVIISLLIIAFVVFYYRYNETVLAYIYVHIPFFYCCSLSNVDRSKIYDAFLSYTGPDRDTVLAIVEELETKPPYFKLCIHERDWMAGYPIISQIETSVKNSKKTIVILTKNFLDSFWCETEFQTAYLQSLEDRIDRIIIVVKGDLPERETMSLDVQNLLASKTYLVWGERWFWEKLRYALPHYISSVKSKNVGKIEEVEGMISELMQRK